MTGSGDTMSPGPLNGHDSLAYYKTQYEILEAELAEFQASSKELEAELEKDVEIAEKRERELKQKVELLTYELEEWKTKCKQAKTEAGAAQNGLQKEITGLRESNRNLQSKLRDIEVSNDDMERQARHTTSSLEDLESKYNIAIERGVLADEEIKNGEQEREALRIEVQRLRDELSDLKIEAELRQDRLRKAEAMVGGNQQENAHVEGLDQFRPQSALSERSPSNTTSSPTVTTPPAKSTSSTMSETQTPPSPPTSDKSGTYNAATQKAALPRLRTRQETTSITPRPPTSSRLQRYSRGPYVAGTADKTPSSIRPRNARPSTGPQRPGNLVQSGSLYHLHGLMNKMQSLEQRVHSVRSKLPAPTSTPPRASPRSGSSLGQSSIPSNVTVRSSKKRSAGSNASSIPAFGDRPSSRLSSSLSQTVDRPSSRLSSGIPHPSPFRDVESNGASGKEPGNSRPVSRTSHVSRQSISHLPSSQLSNGSRPSSRQSMTGSRTPLGHYPVNSQTEPRRPRSSMGGYLQQTEEEEAEDVTTPTPSRRSTYLKDSSSGIPSLPSHKPRSSTSGLGRRTSSGTGEMGPPDRRPCRKLSEVGESY